MSSTLTGAKAAVYAALKAPVGAAGTVVFDHDPTPNNPPRAYMAITFAGTTAEEWLISIRIYSSPANDAATGEALACAAIDATELALPAAMPRTNWTPLLFDPALVLLVADCIVMVPREDF